MAQPKKGIMQRLAEGPVIGDGGFVFALEKRGYVKAGPWTPEATVEHPDAVRELHREFLRAGSDVMQTFTFYASDDKLCNRGNKAEEKLTGARINQAACDLARQVADEGNALVAGGVCQTPAYLSGKSKTEVQAEFTKQLGVFVDNKVDFMICEYFEHVEEAVWAVEITKTTFGKDFPVAATLCIDSAGDMHGNSIGECALQLAGAGADIIGINCHFDPTRCIAAVAKMKAALDAAGIEKQYMVQPLGYHTPDASRQGFIDLPEFPFGLEPRILTRWDMHKYARDAWNAGIHYIGGCCGFEAYHVRAVAEELEKERKCLPAGSDKHAADAGGLKMHTKPWVRARASKKYWTTLNPSTGRPFSASLSKPDEWGVTAGENMLKQQKEETTVEEVAKLVEHQKTKLSAA